jgi:hypothetical protein
MRVGGKRAVGERSQICHFQEMIAG